MAKPIEGNPVIKGRSARRFRKMFLSKTTPSPESVERNKKDIEVYRAMRQYGKREDDE